MERRPTTLPLDTVPAVFHHILRGAKVFDSSCSPESRVYYLQKGGGYYLKVAPKGSLKAEADMTRYFYDRQLGAEVFFYLCHEQDWLLTRALPGEDCIHAKYLDDPKRLCDTTATLLRRLHELNFEDCPIPDRTTRMLDATRNSTTFRPNRGFSNAEEARQVLDANGHLLQNDTLIHGDYCLPNILLDRWRFSAFLDLGLAGAGDKHIDLHWGIWSLAYNLKTNAYQDRFLDAYGREHVEEELLRTAAALASFG